MQTKDWLCKGVGVGVRSCRLRIGYENISWRFPPFRKKRVKYVIRNLVIQLNTVNGTKFYFKHSVELER